MKYLALSILLSASSVLFSQNYHPLITPGKQSFYNLHCDPCPSTMDGIDAQIYFGGDTVILGKTYKKMMASYVEPITWLTKNEIVNIIREDSIDQKVYRFAGSEFDSLYSPYYFTDILMWDYNLHVGDTFTYNIPSYSIPFERHLVAAIDTITLSNNHHVRVFKDNYGFVLFSEEILSANPAYSVFCYNRFNYYKSGYGGFICAQGLNGEGLYPNNCSSQYYVGVEENSTIQIEVFPNPASEYLVIKSPEKGSFKIYDLTGKLVFDTIIAEDSKLMFLPKLSTGLFIWTFETKKSNQVGKLVIENN